MLSMCNQQLTDQGTLSLSRHIRSIHKGVKYPCNRCEYQATRQYSLKRHIQSKHEGVKYACNQCDYQSCEYHGSKEALRYHMKIKHLQSELQYMYM